LDYNESRCIDLHVHSTASDGTSTPSEIIALAHELGLGAVAITDHDTLAGSKEALGLTIPATLEFVTGIEISAAPLVPSDGISSYHILGYFIQLDDPKLNQAIRRLQENRRQRNHEILQRLRDIDIVLEMGDLETPLASGEIGRPHFATALMNKNIVHSIDEAFDQYLGKGKPAFVDKERLSCRDVIQLIQNAGGVPVLAHPGLLKTPSPEDLEIQIASLKQMGLAGIEVYYPEHSDEIIDHLIDIANRHDLLITGGTDFHGQLKPELKMGSGYGHLNVPYHVFETLRARAQAPDNLTKLETTLGYRFQDAQRLAEAIRHSSFVNERPDLNLRDNERFEFLGDAVLNLVVGHILMQRYPELKEGDLTRIRANMVNESQLAVVAESLDIGRRILMGKGEFLSGGHQKKSILADAMEAIIAAVYLDGGLIAAVDLIEHHFAALFNEVGTGIQFLDYKSELQELIQLQRKPTPDYQVVAENGPDHDKIFSVQAKIGEIQTLGQGKSKKAAEQDAARLALLTLKSETS